MSILFGRRVLWVVGLGSAIMALWFARLSASEEFYTLTAELDWYPPEADSIGIPIFADAMLTYFGSPVVLLAVVLVLIPFPKNFRLFTSPEHGRRWNLLFTIGATWLIYEEVRQLLIFLEIGAAYSAKLQVGWIAVWVLLRDVLVVRSSRWGVK